MAWQRLRAKPLPAGQEMTAACATWPAAGPPSRGPQTHLWKQSQAAGRWAGYKGTDTSGAIHIGALHIGALHIGLRTK